MQRHCVRKAIAKEPRPVRATKPLVLADYIQEALEYSLGFHLYTNTEPTLTFAERFAAQTLGYYRVCHEKGLLCIRRETESGRQILKEAGDLLAAIEAAQEAGDNLQAAALIRQFLETLQRLQEAAPGPVPMNAESRQ